MSFYTSLSGLQASQTDMSVISNNLANVSTNGFKKSDASFADVMASSLSTSPTKMIGSGTVTKSITQDFGQGSMKQSSSALDLAITGDGFFAVKPNADGTQVNFTRAGSFQVDANRYVVDSNGSNLQVYPVDGSGAVVATGLDQTVNLRLPETSGTATATSNVALGVNLNSNSTMPSGSFDRFDPTTYNQSTATTIYDSNGNPLTMTSYFVRKTAADTTDPTSTSTWDVYNYVGDTELTPTGGSSPVTMTFDSSGALTSPTTATSFDPFTPGSSSAAQGISLDLASSTQLASPFNVASRTQDGQAVGQLQGVTVNDKGMVVASFSNGDTQALGQVALANFSNPKGLRQLGNGYWASTGVSGSPTLGSANTKGFGSLSSGMIEGSNVDITEELVNLIAAQRNFQANAKALDTSNQISQTIFNLRS
ncbi:flagellar hook protein FlgE [Stakelama sediminis]|uniref:Flagellar hook protein FlgE n=1 Tax=Stakelama sediminis TaxID=463200 RepID=A0A840YWJ8_9SPHN|nr:flagellar hook protein FlgE [Stakelama sediminis]MBB5718013.1 flagellar hook protein FlgE [Stakelama sediminis]